jgi:hypothetical protein
LLVLHDLVLFPSRAAMFFDSEPVRVWRGDFSSAAARDAARPLLEAWRAELLYSYPARGGRLFEVHLGTVGELLPYEYPLFRIPVEVSRRVVVHNSFMARAVEREVPEADVAVVPLPAERAEVPAEKVEALRRRLGFAAGDLVLGVFGLLTAEKRSTPSRESWRATSRAARHRLLLVGRAPACAARGSASQPRDPRSCTVTGRVPGRPPRAHRGVRPGPSPPYPRGRETRRPSSARSPRRPTIVSDLEHLADLPGDAVRRIPLASEEDALLQAVLDLAGDPPARARLGLAAADYTRRAHGADRVREAWERVLATPPSLPAPRDRDWPAHWAGG